MWLFTLFLIALYIIYYMIKSNYNYWKSRNVVGPEPNFIVGNLIENFLMKKSIVEIFNDIYKEYEQYPVVGIYRGCSPNLIIRDPELIRIILVKNFKNFYNNDIDLDKKLDPIVARNPFIMNGEEWKNTRSQLTPGFTSGKMKAAYNVVEEVCKDMVKYISNKNGPLDVKQFSTYFTLDCVAESAFGIKSKCFENPKSEFIEVGKNLTNPDVLGIFKYLTMFMLPSITNYFPLKVISKSFDRKFSKIILETIKYREENNIVINDFLQLIMQLKNTNKLCEEDVVGYAAAFFGDGFETSAIVFSFILLELARNQEVQNNLRLEIQEAIEKTEGNLNYEIIHNEMKYLDAVLSESLRKNPPLALMGKICNEKFIYTPSEESDFKNMSVTIEPGMALMLPVQAIQNDPKYFPEPEIFNPDRFMGENKNNIVNYSYFPFGDGPRSCLGKRFGILLVKVGVVNLIKNFELKLNGKTKIPLKSTPFYFMLNVDGGIWIDFMKIDKT